MRRTQVQVEVLGLQDLISLNQELTTHSRRINSVANAYLTLGGAMTLANPALQKLGNTFVTFDNRVQNVNRSIDNSTTNINKFGSTANNTSRSMENLLGTMLKYRAISAIFTGIEKTVGDTIKTMLDLERQVARVQRVSAPGQSYAIGSILSSEVLRTGADLKDVGEAAYQIRTQVKNADDALKGLRATMNLVVGTEADSREASRALLTIVNQFPNAFGASATTGDKLQRTSELLAGTWKASASELSDVIGALKYLAPAAEVAGVHLEEVMALITGGTLQGQRGRQFGTGMAQVLLTLLKEYDTKIGGIEKGGFVFHFPEVANADGKGISAVKTLIEMVRALNSEYAKSPEMARKMELAIFGNIQGLRVGATQTIASLKNIEAQSERNRLSLQGQTHDAEELRKQMTTTATEASRVWQGALTTIGSLIDASGLRGLFHDWAEDITKAANALHGIRGAEVEKEATDRRLFSTSGPTSILRTRETIQQVLQNYRDHLNVNRYLTNDPTATYGMQNTPDFLTEGLTQPQRDMIRHRYFSTPKRWHDILMDMTRDERITTEQMNAPGFGATGPLRPALIPGIRPLPPGLGVDGKPVVTGSSDDAAKAADEALKKHIEEIQNKLSIAQADYKIKSEQLGEANPKTIGAAQYVDVVSTMLAKLQNDPATLMLNKAGIGTTAAQNREAIQRGQEKAAQEAQKAADDHERALEEQRKLYASGGPNQLQSFLGFPIPVEAIDAFQSRPQTKEAIDAYNNAQKFAEAQRQLDIEGVSTRTGDFTTATGDRLRAIQRQSRLGGPFADQNALGSAAQRQSIAVIQSAMDDLVRQFDETFKAGLPTQAIEEALKGFQTQLEDAQDALKGFADEATLRAYQQKLKQEDDAYSLRVSDIEHSHRLRFTKDGTEDTRNQIGKLNELLGTAQDYLQTVLGHPINAPGRDSEVERAKKQVQEAQQNLQDYKTDAAIQRYQNVRQPVQQEARQAVLDALHGKGSAGDLFSSLGGSIVNAALEPLVKTLTNPLVDATTQQILALKANTDGIISLTSVMGGGQEAGIPGGSGSSSSPLAGVVAGGVAAGFAAAAANYSAGPGTSDFGWGPVPSVSAGGRKSPVGSLNRPGSSDLSKGLGAAFAAYSIGSTSAQQGVNLGNLIGAVGTGFALGGPIGAAAGGVIDLIGGLFHHRQTPTATPQDLNPAYYNAPSAFDVGAYNYSAYGKLPTLQNVGFAVTSANTPTINVYVDGAKVAAKQEISNQGRLATVTLNSHMMDRHSPN